MVDAMRAMLDELMGKERDVPVDKRSNQHSTFNSKEVCKYALCGLCPYGMFKNTKSDLGTPAEQWLRCCGIHVTIRCLQVRDA